MTSSSEVFQKSFLYRKREIFPEVDTSLYLDSDSVRSEVEKLKQPGETNKTEVTRNFWFSSKGIINSVNVQTCSMTGP